MLDAAAEETEFALLAEPCLPSEIANDLLQMLFICCDERLPQESQLVLALKVLCGFSVREIAARLFITEANAYKRLSRARAHFQEERWTTLSSTEQRSRVNAVQSVLYVLFTEGYLSSRANEAIRRDLCQEALRLAETVARHPVGDAAESDALVALMKLHLARLGARTDAGGELLLLSEQDRRQWDAVLIEDGLRWLERSARGDELSRYHVEAAIAAEHCLAASVEETNWPRVVELYELLEHRAPSPLHRLNRALAVAECRGAEAGLAVLDDFSPPTWLEGSFMWSAVLADLHRRAGHVEEAERHEVLALRLAPPGATRELLLRRLRQSISLSS